MGITYPEVKPTHTFKQIANRVGIPENIHDEITGHEQASIGRDYAKPTFEDMADAMKKFPRYSLE